MKKKSRDHLAEEIAEKEQKVNDLSELETRRDVVLAALAKIEAEKKLREMERKVFESLLGIVGSSLSIEAAKKFGDTIPELFALANVREHSPELLRNFIIRELSGGTLEILHCNSCQARFYVDRPAPASYKRHNCQHCGSPLVETVVNGPEIIKKALDAIAPKIMFTPISKPKGDPHKNSE